MNGLGNVEDALLRFSPERASKRQAPTGSKSRERGLDGMLLFCASELRVEPAVYLLVVVLTTAESSKRACDKSWAGMS